LSDSIIIHESGGGLGQLNLDMYRCKMNSDDRNLSQSVTSQSKITLAIDTFKPLKSVEEMRLLPALLQQGVSV
jgi:hypothetical protein